MEYGDGDGDGAPEKGIPPPEEDAALASARRAVEMMTEEEREAALERHEEREATSRYGLDPTPEALDLDGTRAGDALRRAMEELDRARADRSPRSGGIARSDPGGKMKRPRNTNGGGSGDRPYLQPFAGDAEDVACDVERRTSSRLYRSMLEQRRHLPAQKMSDEIASSLLADGVSAAVVSGETGCGKTTQVPRILVEHAARGGFGTDASPRRLNVLVAQPRRIAAVGVAERVADEGGTGFQPGEVGCEAGYHIRHERRVGRDASIVFATTGVVLRVLAGDPMLRGIDVVVVDEVHERSSDGDFLVAALRDLAYGPRGAGTENPLRLILMSATVETDFFVRYLSEGAMKAAAVVGRGGGARPSPRRRVDVPVVHIEGVAYPVKDFYLEDAVEACLPDLQVTDDMFHPPGGASGGRRGRGRGSGQGGGNGPRGGRRGGRGGGGSRGEGDRGDSLVSGGGHANIQTGDGAEGNARSQRYNHMCQTRGGGDAVANLVREFDIRAKVTEKERHLKSVSSGDLPLGLAYNMILWLDKTHRPEDRGDGAILVFLPGYDDITKLQDALMSAPVDQADRLHVLTLHGSMPTTEQRHIFRKPPLGKRKVVISTNVAESSITVDDVVYCLDLGKHKEKTYDPRSHIECLLPTWISKASARQRRGRAGRVRAGECWHLYPSWYVRDGIGVGSDGNGSGWDGVPGGRSRSVSRLSGRCQDVRLRPS